MAKKTRPLASLTSSGPNLLEFLAHQSSAVETAADTRAMFILDYLGKVGSIARQDLASDLGLDRQTTDELIERLLEGRLVRTMSSKGSVELTSKGANLITETLDQVSTGEPRWSVKSLISTIARLSNATEQEIAQKVGVDAATVSRWRMGRSKPSAANLTALESIVSALSGANQFEYVCSFAEHHSSEIGGIGTQILREVLAREAVGDVSARATDLLIRTAPLPGHVSAQCFRKKTEHGETYVVLVSDRLSSSDRDRVAWEEVFAHVAPIRPVDQPHVRPTIRKK